MARMRLLFEVYGVDGIGGHRRLGRVWAVSAGQAVNFVRFRLWGNTPAEDIGLKLVAKPVAGRVPLYAKLPVNCRLSRDRQLVWREMLRP